MLKHKLLVFTGRVSFNVYSTKLPDFYTKVGSLTEGMKFCILAEGGRWFLVVTKNCVGWLYKGTDAKMLI